MVSGVAFLSPETIGHLIRIRWRGMPFEKGTLSYGTVIRTLLSRRSIECSVVVANERGETIYKQRTYAGRPRTRCYLAEGRLSAQTHCEKLENRPHILRVVLSVIVRSLYPTESDRSNFHRD